MKKLLIAAAVLAGMGYAATAQAGRDDAERNAWFQTMHSVPPPGVIEQNLARDRMIEGRNAAVANPRGVRIQPRMVPYGGAAPQQYWR